VSFSGTQAAAVAVTLAIVALAYRRIEVAGRLMAILWAGMLLTVSVVIVAGLTRFDAARAFDFPEHAWKVDGRFAFGLGAALGIAMYDMLGYYQVCYLGDEVSDPARTLPRAILISAPAVALIYLAMNVAMLGVLPWRRAIASEHVASDFLLERFGPGAAQAMTVMILWTALASIFAGLLSYSRIPFAAAQGGHFFRALGATHPRGQFPHRSLLLLGAVTAGASLFDLTTVIDALLTSRILIQFVGQIGALAHVHRVPELRARLSYRMALYPLPAVFALLGWIYVFGTTRPPTMLYGVLSLLAGVLAFLAWERAGHRSVPPEAGESPVDPAQPAQSDPGA
jgi:amino acid transporter